MCEKGVEILGPEEIFVSFVAASAATSPLMSLIIAIRDPMRFIP